MKKLNSKGFVGIELIILIVVVLALGATAFYVLKKNEHKDATDTQTVSQSTSQSQNSQNSELKEYKNTEHGFSFQYPSTWQLKESLQKSDRAENRTEGDVTVTSPSGTVVHFGPNFGGKGGDCIDDQTGTDTTRTCPTLTVYSTEKMTTPQDVDQIYFYQASVTDSLNRGGKTAYMIFISNNGFYPKQAGSVLGALFLPHDEVSTAKSAFTIYVEGKDSTKRDSKAYFDSTEAKEATPVLKSFRLL